MNNLTEIHSSPAARQDMLTNASVEDSAAGPGSCHMSKNKKPLAAMANTSCQTRCEEWALSMQLCHMLGSLNRTKSPSTCLLGDTAIQDSRMLLCLSRPDCNLVLALI